MKPGRFIALNGLVFIALGVAFALYGPLMIDLYGILEVGDNSILYWYTASFARLYGAALFGFGFILWALQRPFDEGTLTPVSRRAVLFSLVLSHLLALIVAISQQVSIWGPAAGWITAAIYLFFLAGYVYLMAIKAYQ